MSALPLASARGRGTRVTAACVATIIVFHLAAAPSLARAQSSQCATVVEQSSSAYQDGRFDEAIAALDECLRNGGIEQERRGEAYRILALSHIAKDEEDRARTAIHQLLLLEPQWQPHPVDDPPELHRLVAEARTAMSEAQIVSSNPRPAEQKKRKSWWLLGSLLAAGGALAVVLLSGGDDEPAQETDLPEPPGLPED